MFLYYLDKLHEKVYQFHRDCCFEQASLRRASAGASRCAKKRRQFIPSFASYAPYTYDLQPRFSILCLLFKVVTPFAASFHNPNILLQQMHRVLLFNLPGLIPLLPPGSSTRSAQHLSKRLFSFSRPALVLRCSSEIQSFPPLSSSCQSSDLHRSHRLAFIHTSPPPSPRFALVQCL
jgi:hypothetical protein